MTARVTSLGFSFLSVSALPSLLSSTPGAIESVRVLPAYGGLGSVAWLHS
jgi:hypothetical protein